MSTQTHPNGTPMITGDPKIDVAIAKWIKGTEDRLSVELMINKAMIDGTLPRSANGHEWTAEMITEYAIMITPYDRCHFCAQPAHGRTLCN